MPRYRRSGNYRRGSVAPLVVMLLIAVVLLILIRNGRTITVRIPHIDLSKLPNITIPITGLPEIQVPTVQIQVPTIQIPITIVPGAVIAGTPLPVSAPAIEVRTKTSGCQIQGALPDRSCTPGSVLSLSADRVCQSGYASSVRNVPQSEENQVFAEYGIQTRASGQYEVDHLVSLELGGSNDIANLWPEAASPVPGFHQKDAVENYLHDQVCSGKISLADAQKEIASNWLNVYNRMPK